MTEHALTDAGGSGTAPEAATAELTLYFALALGICWLALLPPSLAALGMLPGPAEGYMQAAPLAVFSPTIAAMIAARREGGRPAMREVWSRFGRWRVHPIWYVLALTLPGLLYAAARGVYGLAVDDPERPWICWPGDGQRIAAMLIVPFAEEVGWRGYALPRLWKRYGGHGANWRLGALWALWHLPMFLSVGCSWPTVLVAMLFIFVGNAVYTWFFAHTGGSLLLAFLLHVGGHLDNPTQHMDTDPTSVHLLFAGFAVAALAVLVLDRKAFSGPPPSPRSSTELRLTRVG